MAVRVMLIARLAVMVQQVLPINLGDACLVITGLIPRQLPLVFPLEPVQVGEEWKP